MINPVAVVMTIALASMGVSSIYYVNKSIIDNNNAKGEDRVNSFTNGLMLFIITIWKLVPHIILASIITYALYYFNLLHY